MSQSEQARDSLNRRRRELQCTTFTTSLTNILPTVAAISCVHQRCRDASYVFIQCTYACKYRKGTRAYTTTVTTHSTHHTVCRNTTTSNRCGMHPRHTGSSNRGNVSTIISSSPSSSLFTSSSRFIIMYTRVELWCV